MKPMDIDFCVKNLIDAYHVSPDKDPEAYMECLCCLNPSLKEDKPTLNAIYGSFLEWWFTRRDCLTNDLEHRVKRIMTYYRSMIRMYYRCDDLSNEDLTTKIYATYGQEIEIQGKRYDAGILWDILTDLVERALLKTLDR